MKKNIFWFAGLALICAGLFAACSTETTSPESLIFPVEKSPQFTATVKYTEATPNSTATVLATSTPYDYRATELAISDMEARADEARAQMELAAIDMTAEAGRSNARATAEESERQSKELDARIVLAYSELTAVAQDKQNEHDLQAQELAIKAKWANVGIVCVWVLVGGIVALFLVVIVKLWRSVDYRESGESADDEPEFDRNELEKPATTYTHGVTRSIRDNYPCTDAAFKVWALAMLAGGNAGINQWTDAASPFTTKNYPPFLKWAEVDRQFIVSEEGKAKTLNTDGVSYCTDWSERRHIVVPERERTE